MILLICKEQKALLFLPLNYFRHLHRCLHFHGRCWWEASMSMLLTDFNTSVLVLKETPKEFQKHNLKYWNKFDFTKNVWQNGINMCICKDVWQFREAMRDCCCSKFLLEQHRCNISTYISACDPNPVMHEERFTSWRLHELHIICSLLWLIW